MTKEAPGSKVTRDARNFAAGVWILRIGASLELGAWELEPLTPMPGELQNVSIPVAQRTAYVA